MGVNCRRWELLGAIWKLPTTTTILKPQIFKYEAVIGSHKWSSCFHVLTPFSFPSWVKASYIFHSYWNPDRTLRFNFPSHFTWMCFFYFIATILIQILFLLSWSISHYCWNNFSTTQLYRNSQSQSFCCFPIACRTESKQCNLTSTWFLLIPPYFSVSVLYSREISPFTTSHMFCIPLNLYIYVHTVDF